MNERNPSAVACRRVDIDGIEIFYREAGPQDAPVLLLLHGFPTSSHMFRTLMPELADAYHVIAPDLPGFGFSAAPDRAELPYTFESLTKVVERFTERLELPPHALYVFDYGAPIGFRLAMRHPERITAIITQSGNAYLEGVSEGLAPLQKYWAEPTAQNRDALRGLLSADTTRWQYTHGTGEAAHRIAPESYTLDIALLQRPGNDEIQLDLFLDYQTNVALYPEFQAYFREHQPPLLAVWGENDPFFLPPGAHAFKRDIEDAEIRMLDTGHFALETHCLEIAAEIRDFLSRRLAS